MSITTKTGDMGKTSLCCGSRVYKDDPRIEFAGELDELCSSIGVCKAATKSKLCRELLESIQKDLFVLGSEVVSSSFDNRCGKARRINDGSVGFLEKAIVNFEKSVTLKKTGFCLPGENIASGMLDVARTVARRCERRAFALSKKKLFCNANILKYLNRLSDLLFLLAREAEAKPRLLKSR